MSEDEFSNLYPFADAMLAQAGWLPCYYNEILHFEPPNAPWPELYVVEDSLYWGPLPNRINRIEVTDNEAVALIREWIELEKVNE